MSNLLRRCPFLRRVPWTTFEFSFFQNKNENRRYVCAMWYMAAALEQLLDSYSRKNGAYSIQKCIEKYNGMISGSKWSEKSGNPNVLFPCFWSKNVLHKGTLYESVRRMNPFLGWKSPHFFVSRYPKFMQRAWLAPLSLSIHRSLSRVSLIILLWVVPKYKSSTCQFNLVKHYI